MMMLTIITMFLEDREVCKTSPPVVYNLDNQESKYINIHGKNAHDIHDSNNNKPSVWSLRMFIIQCLYLCFSWNKPFKTKREMRAI